jgi:hypothetical protein
MGAPFWCVACVLHLGFQRTERPLPWQYLPTMQRMPTTRRIEGRPWPSEGCSARSMCICLFPMLYFRCFSLLEWRVAGSVWLCVVVSCFQDVCGGLGVWCALLSLCLDRLVTSVSARPETWGL